MTELVIFDCDGVLVDSEVLSLTAMAAVLVEAGVPATAAMIGRCFGMKQKDILAVVARETGVAIPVEANERIWPATRILFDQHLQAMPGVQRFLERLGDRPRCVASSSSLERIRFSLNKTGLARFFGENIFSSQQVARGKPAPDLFLFAAERMGVAPERAVVIEDSTFGVEGARAAGMRAIGFLGGSHIGPAHDAALARSGAEAAEADYAGVERRIFRDALT
ncbi:HAD family phosphatase [Lichenihabitans sp. Uapishka_5]|uniref:HAD family hydrolase n=1 Tax=Lichenihabitans sp. Uapishka_5 TaxID=3037302 RepID=UPI0029E7F3FA|nr:HAD family phosphatase [Lichenihabitans sp. Uapishka_5]MDX7952103.1 HAD family phosphatase [Lichenihabitans sp. Uapishka_5]